MLHQSTNFNEGIGIQEELNALARGQFSFGVLGVDTGLTAAQLGLRVQVLQPVEGGFLSHGAKVQREEPMPKVKRLFF